MEAPFAGHAVTAALDAGPLPRACDAHASPGTVRAARVLTADRSDSCSTAAVAAAAV